MAADVWVWMHPMGSAPPTSEIALRVEREAFLV